MAEAEGRGACCDGWNDLLWISAGRSAGGVLFPSAPEKRGDALLPSFIREYLNPWVIGGYFLLLCSTVLNICGLRGLSFLNGPVMESFGYVFVLFLSRLFFKERITKRKLAGVG